jgi:D-alanyl-lipoteichoic acid acyltransferase DltB (MBOAT superfamily)
VNFTDGRYPVFLLAIFVLYWALRRRNTARKLLLLAAGYTFYAQWNVKYLGLIIFSTALDYVLANCLARTEEARRRRALLACSMIVNLGILGVFKYYGFFATSLSELLSSIGLRASLPTLNILLPVGISFFTFENISYTFDVYRKKIEPANSLLDYAIFVSFFPRMVAGPIIRAANFIPQLNAAPKYDEQRIMTGFFLILKGLAKKIILADMLGHWLVDAVFQDPTPYHGLRVLLAVYAYAFQIYNDFSGYSDIAIGSARMLGFALPANFMRPYIAQNLQDFWHRWHISLSTWLRDYLYIPLGGSRISPARTYLNLFITMVLGGLWHGANWTFVIWGAFHGGILAITRLMQRGLEGEPAAPTIGQRAWAVVHTVLTFNLVCVGWIFFRAPTFHAAMGIFTQLGHVGKLGLEDPYAKFSVLLLFVAAALHYTPARWETRAADIYVRWPAPAQAALFLMALGAFTLFSGNSAPFLYFQF